MNTMTAVAALATIDTTALVAEIKAIDQKCQQLNAEAIAEAGDNDQADAWYNLYDAVLTKDVEGRLISIASALRKPFAYRDNDTSYKEDAQMFIADLNTYANSFE